jgi:hypothetical protein
VLVYISGHVSDTIYGRRSIEAKQLSVGWFIRNQKLAIYSHGSALPSYLSTTTKLPESCSICSICCCNLLIYHTSDLNLYAPLPTLVDLHGANRVHWTPGKYNFLCICTKFHHMCTPIPRIYMCCGTIWHHMLASALAPPLATNMQSSSHKS